MQMDQTLACFYHKPYHVTINVYGIGERPEDIQNVATGGQQRTEECLAKDSLLLHQLTKVIMDVDN